MSGDRRWCFDGLRSEIVRLPRRTTVSRLPTRRLQRPAIANHMFCSHPWVRRPPRYTSPVLMIFVYKLPDLGQIRRVIYE